MALIEQEEERNRLTVTVLKDVDAGRVIAHRAVQAWAESFGTSQPLSVCPNSEGQFIPGVDQSDIPALGRVMISDI